MRKCIITGFEPFGNEKINPSFEAVKLLPDVIGDIEIVKAELPVTFGGARTDKFSGERDGDFGSANSGAWAKLQALIEKENPDYVICTGQAGGRKGLTVERVAINIRDARIPDNAGYQPKDEPIVDGGDAGIFATLPVKAMVQASNDAGIEASVSNSAGTYVCNELMYQLLNYSAHRDDCAKNAHPGEQGNDAESKPKRNIHHGNKHFLILTLCIDLALTLTNGWLCVRKNCTFLHFQT